MIPSIIHSRSQLCSHINEYDNGARSFFVSSDTYPELFSIALPEIVEKAPKGWCYKNMAYLWFPPDALTDDDIAAIEDWKTRFEQYVLIGRNQHCAPHFTNELEFCMALDFNFNPQAERRTLYGEAEYQLKYQRSRPHFRTLVTALQDAFSDLPIPTECQDLVAITSIPSDPDTPNVARSLAQAVAQELGLDYIPAHLLCEKSQMKGLTVEEKIPEWNALYECDECIDLGEVDGRTIVIIDDLYQSGATMWCFAKYLKQQGAQHVLGLVCVKSLRDTDNQ